MVFIGLFLSYLELVVPALWPVGVGAADEQLVLGRLGHHPDVVLTLGLKRGRD